MLDKLRNAPQERRVEEHASETIVQDGADQDSYCHDDPQCPCYVCNNGVMEQKSSLSSDETATGIEFAVRSFWRLAKTQNDVESPMEGHCRGFYYKLLLHPRGTAGTDSEASHLSVFVEASVQDWYPPYWVFPNVRFELTVVNFKDPKQSVTSWAHWSFSSDATSRGWQKMISHSRLTKASGFMDEDGTVLVRGKAEPPYPMLWSNSPFYHPQMMWECIPNRAQRVLSAQAQAISHPSKSKRIQSIQDVVPCLPTCNYDGHAEGCKNAGQELLDANTTCAIEDKDRDKGFSCYVEPYNAYPESKYSQPTGETPELPNYPEGLEPPSPPAQQESGAGLVSNQSIDESDYIDLNAEETLMRLQADDHPGLSNAILKLLDAVIPAIQPTLDADLLALMTHVLYHLREFRKRILMWNPPDSTEEGGKSGTGIVVALQKIFAYMQLYPLAAACKTYRLAGIDAQHLTKYYLCELMPRNPNLKRNYFLSECTDAAATSSAVQNLPDRLQNVRYEIKTTTKKGTRNSTQKKGPWVRLNVPPPFPRPLDPDGYDADDEFKHPGCCYFDGGRYEWEVKRKRASDDEKVADNANSNTSDVNKDTTGSPINEGQNQNYRLLPGTLSFSIGNRGDFFDKILPPPPNIKLLLKAMHMSDLQVLETQDQLINIHTELFSMLLMDLAAAKRNIKQKRLMEQKEPGEVNLEDTLPWYLRDQTDLEMTCKALFSGAGDNEGLFHNGEVNDISSIYIRCKHSHSLQKALENTTKTMAKYPEVLFFYLYPAKNAKKGELFDIPLRLDCTNLCEGAVTPEEQYDVAPACNMQKMATAGHNACDARSSAGPMDYCDYSDDEDDDDEEPEDGLSDGFGNFDNEEEKGKHSAHVKWYSLYALILREGDIRSDGTGGNFHSLLLRPEEDGPWYRIGEGRVEKLLTKMDFTEWKCHRDFFCAAAIYVAEDYIDMLQVGEVDLSGNLKTWNRKLFYETLDELGVSEQDIINLAISAYSQKPTDSIVSQSQFSGDEMLTPNGSITPTFTYCRPEPLSVTSRLSEVESSVTKYTPVVPIPKHALADRIHDDEFVRQIAEASEYEPGIDVSDMSLIYNRKIGQRHPRLGNCCEMHGYSIDNLETINDIDVSTKRMEPVTDKEICRRLNRVQTIKPFMRWLFFASKENTFLLNSVKDRDKGKLLVRFLQKRERFFEEEFCHLISEMLLKEIGEHMALHNIYRWESDKSWCGCSCTKCEKHCPALLLTENGRFPGEDLKSLLKEPSTILFRNIQILRCHLEYFCKDCRNLSLQEGRENMGPDIHEFKATSERSALFLIECIWDACVRYTHDCRTILYLKAISDNPSATITEIGFSKVTNLMKPNTITTKKQPASKASSSDQGNDLFVFDGTLSQNPDYLEETLVDCYDTKFDITLAEELRIMRYFSAKYQLPTVVQMRKFLRENHVLVYGFVRPHELVRAYLEVKCPGENIKGEIESMVPNIVWNDEVFNQRVAIEYLSEATREMYDVKLPVINTDDFIGYNLCDLYEELVTRMLLHMQDAERGLSDHVFDYMYTCGDVARVIEAIELECVNTLMCDTFSLDDKPTGDQCTCDAISSECKVSPVLSSSSYLSELGVTRAPFALDFVDIAPRTVSAQEMNSESASLSGESIDAAAKPSETKKKQKAKDRKDNADSVARVIPPFDIAIRDITISQKNAHAADPKLFPDLTEASKYPNATSHRNSNMTLSALRRLTEYNSLLHGHTLGYDFNVAAGFANMLKLENYGMKATPSPHVRTRKISDAQAQKLKQAYELGIVTSNDLSGCEGFASEEKFIPTKRLVVYHECVDPATNKKVPTRVEHLYWGLRRLMLQQMPTSVDSSFLQANKSKKAKGATKCICGDGLKRRTNSKTPDIILLIVGAPLSLCVAPATPFPLMDDSEYPLLLFKWMCSETVDLICYGAVVCDAKKQLQHYIFDWLLPLVRDLGVLPKLRPNEKEDIDRYQILEECSVRTVQNVRRWSCAIRKINKRTGDIIIAQVKRVTDSPATLKLRETTDFMQIIRELEALEFLPPAQKVDKIVDNVKASGEVGELSDKPAEDAQKLGKKKKKKKVTRAAIPSNKKSTFSKSIIPVDTESEDSPDPDQDLLKDSVESEKSSEVSNVTTNVVLSGTSADDREDEDEDDYDEEEDESDDEDVEEEQEDEAANTNFITATDDARDSKIVAEQINVCAIVDEAQEAVASSRTIVDRSALEKRGLPGVRMQEFLQTFDLFELLSNESDKVAEMCAYIQRLMEEELKVDVALTAEPSKDLVIITVGPRTRTCVDILLCLIKTMQRTGCLIAGFRNLVNAIYEQAPLAAASIACYALAAMGNNNITDYFKTASAVEFVRDLTQKMAEQCIAYSWSVFSSALEQCAVSSMLICLYLYAGINDTIGKVCEQNSDLMFLMNVIRDRLSIVADEDEDEHIASVGFRMDAFERFTGFGIPGTGGIADQVHKCTAVMNAFRNMQSPFGDDERLFEFENLALQELRIWWCQREFYHDAIKAALDVGPFTFVLTNGNADELRRNHMDETLPLPISIAEARCLRQCCDRYPGGLHMICDGDMVHVGPRNALGNGQIGSKIDASAVVDATKALLQLVDSRNLGRAVANVALDEMDTPSVFGDISDMRLRGNQTALVTMSMRRSGTLDTIVTADVDVIMQNYHTRSVRHIAPPPKLPPQRVQLVGNHS
ncbi:putative math and lrr domain-containing protein [Babesia sp. Xinjiang]|uniref:putative math and lrr domain-containing protein n=1 Tax=Babesia sp. Xinjiang TaxID=462227 RepID=UPI000A226748|nr:putative math and lrr domain-containing protein [Babesia sp. Xinjiang]ORM39737.1 putative math and lrr domain-containing protein [Babesia sp. Xinjiang]